MAKPEYASAALLSGWIGFKETDSAAHPFEECRPSERDDGGCLETERSEGSVHEAMRPAKHQTAAWQESEEPYER